MSNSQASTEPCSLRKHGSWKWVAAQPRRNRHVLPPLSRYFAAALHLSQAAVPLSKLAVASPQITISLNDESKMTAC